ncbi:GspH/FimT family pseudopilin [Chitinimonas koreensis]|uniref:GspH/FimT family pseudopilin n=1 Tax=Chitinimonas koreensis TaxID=356302 RepID=UPI000407156D|nr:GspH/FimT family pseudopilin [Chitinimonas koreensis]QNM95275.1 GspH/FimT family pseudopilin [Chitinimonas koreensis]
MSTPVRNRRGQRGMTLIEMAMVLAIISIVAAIAAPPMALFVNDARLSSQTNQLVASLNAARLEAITRRTTVTVCQTAAPNSATACSTSGTSDWSNGWIAMTAGGTVLRRVHPSPNLVVTTTSASTSFGPTLGNSTTASYKLCIKGAKEHEVLVAPSGRVTQKVNNSVCS